MTKPTFTPKMLAMIHPNDRQNKLAQSIRRDNLADVKALLSVGADLRDNDNQDYLFRCALLYVKDWSDRSVVKFITDELYGDDAFTQLLFMRSLGVPVGDMVSYFSDKPTGLSDLGLPGNVFS